MSLQDWSGHFLLIFLLKLLWISFVKGQGCPATKAPVANMCTNSRVSGSRVLLDTAKGQVDSSKCTCTLTTGPGLLDLNLITAPQYFGCGSQLNMLTFTFECLSTGVRVDVTSKPQFNVTFHKATDASSNNYCLDIKSKSTISGQPLSVTLNCYAPPGAANATTTIAPSTEAPTRASTRISWSSTAAAVFNFTIRRDDTSQIMTQRTERVTMATPRNVLTANYPSGISKTAIIVIGVAVGLGLLIAILIVIILIIGKRQRQRRQPQSDRFFIPSSSNSELMTENGSMGIVEHEHELTENGFGIGNLHRTDSQKITDFNSISYDNKTSSHNGVQNKDKLVTVRL